MKLHHTSSRLVLAAAGALALSPVALAQDDPDRDTIVVTGVATPVAEEKVGQTITVVPAGLIEDQGYAYVSDVLRQVPGVAVSRMGAPGALTQVRMRGAEANHTLVLVDGIDVSSPDTGETDFSTLMAVGLDRIEVLRGPQSGLYGSNALAGVVNIVSRREFDGHYLAASAEAGSFDTLDLDASAGIGDGDTFASINLNHMTTDGYDTSPDQTANGVPAVGVGGAPGDREGSAITTANARGGVKLSDMLRVNGVARYLKSDADLDGQAYGFPIAGRTYDDASRTEFEQVMVGASATIDPWAGAWETIISVSHVDESRRSWLTDFPFLAGPPVPSPADLLLVPVTPSGTDSTRFRIGAQSTFAFGDSNFANFLTGFAEHEEETYGDAFSSREEDRTLNAFGLQYRAEIAEQLYLSATVRRDQNDSFQDADTWSASAAWAIPDTGARLHGSVGTGVTNPTFIEQFGFNPSTFIGNPSLVPEEALGWDAGVEQTLFEGKLVIDATYFTSTLDNEIFTAFLPTFETTALNSASESDRSGWELTVYADPTDDISLYGTWTRLDASEPSGVEIRRPENTASLDASWRVMGGPWQINLGVSYTGDSVDTDFGTFLPTPVDAYTLVRLGASYKLSDTVELYGRVENLLDEEYEEVIGYRGAPQAAYVGIRFREETRK
ncbi:MAG: TonB-dependent receptor [Hyphomonadaceae bacterium]